MNFASEAKRGERSHASSTSRCGWSIADERRESRCSSGKSCRNASARRSSAAHGAALSSYTSRSTLRRRPCSCASGAAAAARWTGSSERSSSARGGSAAFSRGSWESSSSSTCSRATERRVPAEEATTGASRSTSRRSKHAYRSSACTVAGSKSDRSSASLSRRGTSLGAAPAWETHHSTSARVSWRVATSVGSRLASEVGESSACERRSESLVQSDARALARAAGAWRKAASRDSRMRPGKRLASSFFAIQRATTLASASNSVCGRME
mmetsp:Transcript_20536/g.66112  ORF Transcript_20536/g.66112 Transcript_20536/m.66112 type:complete len:269 (-) Transcript_20536:1074-1880(-)